MKALTLWQPWAWAMAYVGKMTENRTWAPPRDCIGELLAIHGGKTVDREAIADIADEFCTAPLDWIEPGEMSEAREVDGVELVRVGTVDTSAIVAVGVLLGYVRDDGSYYLCADAEKLTGLPVAEIVKRSRGRWYNGPVGWVWAKRKTMERPVPCRGAQGLWNLPADVEAEVRRQMGEVARG